MPAAVSVASASCPRPHPVWNTCVETYPLNRKYAFIACFSSRYSDRSADHLPSIRRRSGRHPGARGMPLAPFFSPVEPGTQPPSNPFSEPDFDSTMPPGRKLLPAARSTAAAPVDLGAQVPTVAASRRPHARSSFRTATSRRQSKNDSRSSQSFDFKSASFSAMKFRMSGDISKSFSHCSLYNVTGNRPMP